MGARLLLVHSPLVGRATWDLVAADLAGRGYRVGVPDLTGTVAAGPPYCSRQAEVIAGSASGEPAILIGHSGAGPLLPAAGALLGQVRGYVFADAGLPTPGQSWMGTVPPGLATWLREMADAQGWLPPWPRWWGEQALAGLIPDPDVRRRFAAGCPPAAAGHVRGDPPAGAALARCAGRLPAAERGLRGPGSPGAATWLAGDTPGGHHLAPLTDPGLVAGSLHELLSQLQRKP
jgi:hypothetical protein